MNPIKLVKNYTKKNKWHAGEISSKVRDFDSNFMQRGEGTEPLRCHRIWNSYIKKLFLNWENDTIHSIFLNFFSWNWECVPNWCRFGANESMSNWLKLIFFEWYIHVLKVQRFKADLRMYLTMYISLLNEKKHYCLSVCFWLNVSPVDIIEERRMFDNGRFHYIYFYIIQITKLN